MDKNILKIEIGNRCFQEDEDGKYKEKYQDNYLLKWADLGFLHCLWEIKAYLMGQVEGVKVFQNNC